MKCCDSKSCKAPVECPACYAYLNHVPTQSLAEDDITSSSSKPVTNATSIVIEDARVDKSTRLEVIQAGCYTADDECLPLSELTEFMEQKFKSLNIKTAYKIPKYLLELEAQNACIGLFFY
jgi:hypothetical protein